MLDRYPEYPTRSEREEAEANVRPPVMDYDQVVDALLDEINARLDAELKLIFGPFESYVTSDQQMEDLQ